jgi:hypothetical protein
LLQFCVILLFHFFHFYSNGSNSQLYAHRFDWKKHDFYFFLILMNLPLYYVFQAPLSLWDFFQLSSTCLVHLKIDTSSLNIMLNNNFNSLTPWDSHNPYNPRLNKKQALWASSKKKKTTTFNFIIS